MSKTEAEGPKLARIDFVQNKLTGKSGKTYFIQDQLSVERYSQFLAFQPMITKGASYQEWAKSNNQINQLATSGNDILGALHQIATITMNMNSTWKEFTEKRYHAIMYFAMLFINREDEDPAIYDERVMTAKIKDLDHYSIQDFFFCVQNVLREWKEDFRKTNGIDPVEKSPAKTVAETLSQEIASSSPGTISKK